MPAYVLAFRQSTRETTPELEQAWSEWFGAIGAQIADFGNRVGAARMVGGQPAGKTSSAATS
jgi:hypothetical protein